MKFELSMIAAMTFCFFGFSARAGITQGKVKFDVKSSEVAITPDKGFHINDKAPASAVYDDAKMKTPPKTKTEQSLVFEIPAEAKKAFLKFFVCDDAKTVCEQHSQEIDLKSKKSKASTATTIDSKTYLAVVQTGVVIHVIYYMSQAGHKAEALPHLKLLPIDSVSMNLVGRNIVKDLI